MEPGINPCVAAVSEDAVGYSSKRLAIVLEMRLETVAWAQLPDQYRASLYFRD